MIAPTALTACPELVNSLRKAIFFNESTEANTLRAPAADAASGLAPRKSSHLNNGPTFGSSRQQPMNRHVIYSKRHSLRMREF